MAVKVLHKNQALAPFLGSRLSIVRGLDPLGLQNASVRTYSYLLPGLNNVTDRIRYYSFYCWLLGAYAKHNGSADPRKQKLFVRKAEYLIALTSRLEDASRTGIPGSDYATRKLKQAALEGYKLSEGVYNPDGSTDNTYWKASFGAFGQYYLGALRQIGLICEPDDHPGVYARTPRLDELVVSGEELRDAFAATIPGDKQALFMDILKRDLVSKQELKQLLPAFDLTQTPKDSKEEELLIRLLTGKDYPTKLEEEAADMRKQSIRLLLSFMIDQEMDLSDRAFTVQAYRSKGVFNDEPNDCLTGWYFYQMNEYWQIACTAILNGVLGYLLKNSPARWMDLSDLLVRSSEETLVALSNRYEWIGKDTSVRQLVERADEFPDEFDLYEAIRREKEQQKMATGFMLIWKLYAGNHTYFPKLKNYTINRGLDSDQDAATFFSRFAPALDKNYLVFLREFLYRHIILRHQYVALRKMGGGSQSTQKFILEEGYIRYLGNFSPAFTGPRVGNLIGFLKDLHIFEDGQITDRGLALLE